MSQGDPDRWSTPFQRRHDVLGHSHSHGRLHGFFKHFVSDAFSTGIHTGTLLKGSTSAAVKEHVSVERSPAERTATLMFLTRWRGDRRPGQRRKGQNKYERRQMEISKQYLPSDKESHCLHTIKRTWTKKCWQPKYTNRAPSAQTLTAFI